MKEKRTYKRFDFLSFLAVLGCVGMILFECIFIFELYDRAVEQPEILPPVSLENHSDVEASSAIKVSVPQAPAVEVLVPAETNSPAVPSEAAPPTEPEVSTNVIPVG